MSVLQLWLPILLSGVAIFFCSFLSWMIVQLHKNDWKKMPEEDAFLAGLRKLDTPVGSYMFPGCNDGKEMQNPEYQQKWKEGPRGVITFYPEVNMGTNLGLTMALFLAVNFVLAYLATIAFQPGEEFLTIFRFFATASLVVYLTGIVQHAIWFKCRIVGHVVESIVYSLVAGGIFAFLWP